MTSAGLRMLSFNAYRTLEMDGIPYVKPELYLQHLEAINQADWLLFPEYWQVNSLVYGLGRRIFPSISTYHLGHDKVETTRALQAICPEHLPFTLILPATETALEQIPDTLGFPFVAKEPRNSMGRGVFLIEDWAAWRAYAARHAVLYAQEYLPLKRDLRVVYVGEKIVAAYWRYATEGEFLNNLARGGRIEFDGVPARALRLVEKVAARLEINHAGFDLAEVDGHFYFLEFNLLFGNQALLSRGIKLGPIILEYLRGMDHPTWPRAA